MKHNHLIKVATAAILMSSLAMSSVVQAKEQPNTSPFTDKLAITFTGFPATGAQLSYVSNNGVNITGDSSATTQANVTISSENQVEDGYPTMHIVLADGSMCDIRFADGPWDFLHLDPIPVCQHIDASAIMHSELYQYKMTLQYKP